MMLTIRHFARSQYPQFDALRGYAIYDLHVREAYGVALCLSNDAYACRFPCPCRSTVHFKF